LDAILVLEDGKVFKGKSFGTQGEMIAEVVFNTGMAGYQEVLTDPSYCGQMIAMTYPLIGNYGVNEDDMESSQIQVAGFIVRELCRWHSNFRATKSLEDWMKQQGIMGLEGIDTRALTRHIRQTGSMNGILTTQSTDSNALAEKARQAPHMTGQDLVRKVTCEKAYPFQDKTISPPAGKYNVTVVDCGAKSNICRELALRGCNVTVVPAQASVEDVREQKPDGIMVSNGPGDPAAVPYLIETIKNLLGKVPIFGICLGHQILSLALGGKTEKMKFGHRGVNHPVMDMQTRKVSITSQNHGFCVDANSLSDEIEITHINMNDKSVEGIRHKKFPVFSVQYHPECSPGPHDAKYLFDTFMEMIEKHKK